MPDLQSVCRYVRSKNAGPYWITVDIFFKDQACYDGYVEAPALQADALARAFDVAPGSVKRFSVPDLHVLKVSFPRKLPQGGRFERDMHGGQQYVRLLGMEL